jgi:hypothetical protein
MLSGLCAVMFRISMPCINKKGQLALARLGLEASKVAIQS